MSIQKNLIVVLCLLLVICITAGCKNSGQPAAQTNPPGETQGGQVPLAEPTAGTTEPPAEAPTGEEGTDEIVPPVQLVMPDYELTYAGTMADIITWEELTEEVGLCFYVELEGEKYPIFSMLLGKAQGDNVHVKKNGAGEEILITFLMEAEPEGLSEANGQTFCMAQDIVNDIANSLILK